MGPLMTPHECLLQQFWAREQCPCVSLWMWLGPEVLSWTVWMQALACISGHLNGCFKSFTLDAWGCPLSPGPVLLGGTSTR